MLTPSKITARVTATIPTQQFGNVIHELIVECLSDAESDEATQRDMVRALGMVKGVLASEVARMDVTDKNVQTWLKVNKL